MPFIAFLGCDGSGKSTVISGVETRLLGKGCTVTRGHWRPAPLDAGRDTTAGKDDPHGMDPRGFPASLAKLAWLWACWWLGWLQGLRRQAKQGFLIFDRYHADLVADPRRYRYGGPPGLAKAASALMPQPDMVFFLDAEPETLRARKEEVPLEALAAARTRYLSLCRSNPRFHVIDASRPAGEVTETVLSKIHAYMDHETP